MTSLVKKVSSQILRLGQLWQEKHNTLIFRWILLLIILQLAVIFFKFNDLPPQVPLYYSLPWGEKELANSASLFMLPVYSIIVFLVDSSLAAALLNKSVLFSRLLLISSLVFSLLSCITLFKIIFLVS
ncbi:MAG TPA: hypothetical protein VF828_00370 [Patescibacteria group bacterium]